MITVRLIDKLKEKTNESARKAIGIWSSRKKITKLEELELLNYIDNR